MTSPARMRRPTTVSIVPGYTRAKLKLVTGEQIECGIYRYHAYIFTGDYRPYNPGEYTGVRNIKRLVKLEQECARCGVIRTDTLDEKTLERVGTPKYDYPESWIQPGIPKGVKPSTVYRQEAYRRAMEKVAHAAPGDRATAER